MKKRKRRKKVDFLVCLKIKPLQEISYYIHIIYKKSYLIIFIVVKTADTQPKIIHKVVNVTIVILFQ